MNDLPKPLSADTLQLVESMVTAILRDGTSLCYEEREGPQWGICRVLAGTSVQIDRDGEWNLILVEPVAGRRDGRARRSLEGAERDAALVTVAIELLRERLQTSPR